MRKPGVANPLNRRRWVRVAMWLAFFVSTAFAAGRVRQFVLDDSRFVFAPAFAEADDTVEFTVHGLQHASRERVARVFEQDIGRNIFLISPAERRRKLLAIDWIEDATIARIWPNRLLVTVRERHPVAFVNLSTESGQASVSKPALIDSEGVILEQPAQAQFSFPILAGVNEHQTERERRDRVRLMQRLLKEIGPLAKDVSEIDVSAADLRVIMEANGHAVDLLLGHRNFARRIQNFLQHYPEIRKRSGNVKEFDLRLDDRITVRE